MNGVGGLEGRNNEEKIPPEKKRNEDIPSIQAVGKQTQKTDKKQKWI